MGLFSSILAGTGGLLGDILGASANKKAIKKAGKAQIGFLQQGIDAEHQSYDTARADELPWITSGQGALSQIGDLLGLNGNDAADAAIEALKRSPMFQRLFQTGEESVLQNASATGGVRGGNTQTALYENGENTLAQVIQQQLGNLGGVSGSGLNAAGNVAGLGAGVANNVAQLLSGMGQVKAGTILGKQQVDNNLTSQITSLITSIMGGVGGGLGGGLSSLGSGAFGGGDLSNGSSSLYGNLFEGG